jgi:hypothetical protein
MDNNELQQLNSTSQNPHVVTDKNTVTVDAPEMNVEVTDMTPPNADQSQAHRHMHIEGNPCACGEPLPIIDSKPLIAPAISQSDNIANPQNIPSVSEPQDLQITYNPPQGSGQPSAEIADKVAPIQENKPKHPGGRPCEYCARKEEIEKKTAEYLNTCRETKGSIPFIEEIADKLGNDAETLMNWANKKKTDDSLEHPQFFDAIKKIKNYQRLQLMKRTLGRYNPTGAIFQLKANHGFIETEKQIHAGDKDEPITYRVVEDHPIKEDE